MKNYLKREGDKRGREYLHNTEEGRKSLARKRKIMESNENPVGHEVSEEARERLQRTWNDERHKQMRAAMRSNRPCGLCRLRECRKHVPVKHLVTGKTYYLLLLPKSLTREFLNPEECRMRAHRAMHRKITEHALKFSGRPWARFR